MVKQKDKPVTGTRHLTDHERRLILYNDDVNTFDFVIESLIDICEHDPEQAEQCALIAHFNGKCIVREGGYQLLKPMCEAMTLRGLSVSIG
jgi:ATP-dependent Clp protease adaptor protein ClpS